MPKNISNKFNAVILAGGKGERLGLLSQNNPKSGLVFGVDYRLIDFAVCNLINSKVNNICCILQYLPHIIMRHLTERYRKYEHIRFDFLTPYQSREGNISFLGTADAVWKNINFLSLDQYEHTIILPADHIYNFNLEEAMRFHHFSKTDVTLISTNVKKENAVKYGNIVTDQHNTIIKFDEKPKSPTLATPNPLVSTGIYIFNNEVLKQIYLNFCEQGNLPNDFGYDTFPKIISSHTVKSFNLDTLNGDYYWNDIASIDDYCKSTFDFIDGLINLNGFFMKLTDKKRISDSFVSADFHRKNNSKIKIDHSILFSNCEIGEGTLIQNSIVHPNVKIGKNCFIKDTFIPEGISISDSVSLEQFIPDQKFIDTFQHGFKLL
ncbi:sugar phosphate nucleotidyltransferase [Legionella worsleiensis]|uniref:Glucose-1-phosphate adenylyltransferase n=1 Tax=Legionella worsleiensis TaxID=45076 RepID=A0A0W1AGF0_9GAMM|nr:sugar phosphate nucleotidyltransferase [Legionella worsleiensis]KTD80227.1 Glucose-1-phosphate adenylyltransferase [Legionella worsleiensis]STY31691.1 Glucose-1-phosphate adenylyltransferase [Legionella worsleiensis]